MSTNTTTGSVDRIKFDAEEGPRILGNLLEALTALYEEVGLPTKAARNAALADLECDFDSFLIAA